MQEYLYVLRSTVMGETVRNRLNKDIYNKIKIFLMGGDETINNLFNIKQAEYLGVAYLLKEYGRVCGRV